MRNAAMIVLFGLTQVPAHADVLEMPAGKEISYEVQKGDTLWDLSDDFYDDPFRYPEIWKANPFIKDPHWIYPGQMLTIPGTTAVADVAPPSPAAPDVAPPMPPAPIEAKNEEPAASPVAAPVVAAAVTAPAAAPKAGLPKINEKFPKWDKDAGLNEDFPPSLAGGEDTMPKRPVAPDWKPLGTIVEEDFLNAADGDTVKVKWREDVNLLPGEVIFVVHDAGDAMDPNSPKKKIGKYLQTLAQIRVTQATKRTAEGIVEKARDGVQPGDAVQLGAP